MKKVYQQLVDKDLGDCMQAVVASLFELELNEVPKFIELGSDWHSSMWNFFKERGYNSICTITKHMHDEDGFLQKVAHFDGGVDGYFYASVKSKTYEGVGHAVVVDKDLNVVHDPNPSGLCLDLKPDDIVDIMVVHPMIIGATGKLFKRDDWDNASEEERNENTHKSISK